MPLPDPGAVHAALVRERATYESATIDNAAMGRILNAVALQFPGLGMHRKDGEKAAPIAGMNVTVSRDVLRYLPEGDNFGWWSDVLGATGAGLATPLAPEWLRSTDDRASFVPPVGVQTPAPPVVKDPPVPSVDLSAVFAELAALKARVLLLESRKYRIALVPE